MTCADTLNGGDKMNHGDKTRDGHPLTGLDAIKPQMKATVLAEALPFMQTYDRQTVVIKYGGHAMGDASLAADFARDVVLLKQAGVRPVVVHGGGPQISAMLKRLQISSEFEGGQRKTCSQTIEVVEMVLAGTINKQIVAAINAEGGQAVGISGKDAHLMTAQKLKRTVIDPDSNVEKAVDLGFVGEPQNVNPYIVNEMARLDVLPVVAPIGVSTDGQTYNINADTFAGALAATLRAKRLLLLTDVPGVLGGDGQLISELTPQQARSLISDGTISGGMIPKIESCISVLNSGVEGVVILNGKVPHAVLLELFTAHGVGTLLEHPAAAAAPAQD